MKYLVATVGLLAAAAGVAGIVSYRVSCEPALGAAVRSGDPTAWLRAEFHLDDAQFAAIQKLHADYHDVCAGHCAAIMAAKQRRADPAEIAALEAACVRSMTDHFRRVAALMPPGEGDRYLALILPRVANYDHRGPPTLQVSP